MTARRPSSRRYRGVPYAGTDLRATWFARWVFDRGPSPRYAGANPWAPFENESEARIAWLTHGHLVIERWSRDGNTPPAFRYARRKWGAPETETTE